MRPCPAGHMHIGFGRGTEQELRVEFKLGKDLKNIIFLSEEGLPPAVIERLHTLREEVLAQAQQEIITALRRTEQALQEMTELLDAEAVLDDELLDLAEQAQQLRERLAAKLPQLGGSTAES